MNYDNDTEYFYWTNVYNLSDTRKDLWNVEYTQSIHFIFWEPTLATIKNINILKLIVWRNSVIWDNTLLKMIFHYWGYKFTYVLDKLKDIDFFNKINLSNTTTWLWTSQLWEIMLWNKAWYILTEWLWDIWIWKINIWQLCHLFEWKIEASWEDYIEFGGFLLGYSKVNPTVENIDNTYVS